jgi:predicted nuclease of predicted toxin-antitoxin system
MKLWIDAQLPPTLASWVTNNFGIEALSLRDVGLRDAKDIEIFEAARIANVIIMTKDAIDRTKIITLLILSLKRCC